MKNRIVILGAKGFVGSNISKVFIDGHYDIINISRNECDYNSIETMKYLNKNIYENDIVVLAFAKAPVKNWDMFNENISMINNVLKSLSTKKIKYLLNISSDAVYGDSHDPIDEKSLISPANPHGIMHATREYLINKNISCKLGHLRPTLIYGNDDPHNGYGPNLFLRTTQENNTINLFGEGEELRDHIHINDVALLAKKMIEKELVGELNAVTGKLYSFKNIAEIIRNRSNTKINIVCKKRNGPMPHNGYREFSNNLIKNYFPEMKFNSLENYFSNYFEN